MHPGILLLNAFAPKISMQTKLCYQTRVVRKLMSQASHLERAYIKTKEKCICKYANNNFHDLNIVLSNVTYAYGMLF